MGLGLGAGAGRLVASTESAAAASGAAERAAYVEKKTAAATGTRIVIERLCDGNWSATYYGTDPFTIPDARNAGRAVELMQRTLVMQARQKKAVDAQPKEKAKNE